MTQHPLQSLARQKRFSIQFQRPFILAAVLLITPSLLRGDEPVSEAPLTAEDRDHWSFKPLTRPAVPVPDAALHETNPIDSFILARLAARQLTPQSTAIASRSSGVCISTCSGYRPHQMPSTNSLRTNRLMPMSGSSINSSLRRTMASTGRSTG